MRWNVLVAGSVLVLSAVAQACVTSADDGVVAMNLATGETREFAADEDVPDGWVTCDEDASCPDPLACDQIDESACLVRSDCAPIYAADGDFDGCVDGGEPTCEEEACGPAPGMPAFECYDGTIGGFTGRCLAHEDGECGWEILDCPEPPSCEASDCPDPAPGAPNYLCEDGSTAGPACLPASDGSCDWAILECPEDGTCDDEAKCGPALGMPAYVCEDGSVGGNTGKCLDNGDDTCSWEIRECPEENQGG